MINFIKKIRLLQTVLWSEKKSIKFFPIYETIYHPPPPDIPNLLQNVVNHAHFVTFKMSQMTYTLFEKLWGRGKGRWVPLHGKFHENNNKQAGAEMCQAHIKL